MSIKLGDKSISAIYLGDKQISKAYLGANLVYQKEVGNGLPCYVQNITIADNMTDAEVEVFYTSDGKVIVSVYSDTIAYSSVALNSSSTLDGVTRFNYTVNYLSGHLASGIFEGITKPCNISLSSNTSMGSTTVSVLFTETTSTLKQTKNQYIQNITYTGTYASSTYFTESGTMLGYSESGNIILIMQGGTTSSYENLYICGDNITKQSSYSTNISTGNYYAGVIEGITSNSDIEVQMNSRNSSDDYVKCNVVITEV